MKAKCRMKIFLDLVTGTFTRWSKAWKIIGGQT